MGLRVILPEIRRKAIRKILCEENRMARILEAHNGLSAILVCQTYFESDDKSIRKEFDGMWISGLTENFSRGLPDIELQGMLSRIGLVREIINVTNKPIIVDADTGGTIEQLQRSLRTMELLGVSGVIIEDKIFPKNNSLDLGKAQILEKPEVFANKIKQAKSSLQSTDMMIIARIEALIAGLDVATAIKRAEVYLAAGADAIVIHSNKKSPDEVLSFAKEYHKLGTTIPLVSIPTTYNTITEQELEDAGFKLVIHANHMLRSAYASMKLTASSILKNGRSLEADANCIAVKNMLEIGDGF